MTSPGLHATDSGGAPRAPAGEVAIVAFDFDGTLTASDSFAAFLRWRASGWRWVLGLLRLAPAALVYLASRDRGRLKAASVRIFLQGLSRGALATEAEAFAAANFDLLMRPDALAAWAEHGRRGAPRVIVTASPEDTVAPFARRLGAEGLIGSRLRWTPQGQVGDGLKGANCRGAEKVRRLREHYGPDVHLGDAYGDTAGDREMLALADRGHMRVFLGAPEIQRAPLRPAGSTPSRRS